MRLLELVIRPLAPSPAISATRLLTFAATLLLATTSHGQTCPAPVTTRLPFFGDVHVHTRLSFDSYTFDTRAGPREAYLFARGESIDLPPLDPNGSPTRPHRLRRPLDFAAVTDHAEMLGETSLCTTGGPDGDGLDAPACAPIADGNFGLAGIVFGSQFRDPEPMRRAFCGEGGALCLAEAASVWQEIISAANDFDDPDDDCSFTTFVGYEWTASPDGDNLHRNVLFRNAQVPPLPLSYTEVQDPRSLWLALESQCQNAGPDCEVLTIPHNSNQSRGQTFLTTESDGSPLSLETALLRRELEPLVELIQHKGDSECRPGVGTNDERCGFEKIAAVPPEDDAPLAYVRNVLRAGLALEAEIGTNPFRLGLIGSSDTHNATPGATAEDDFAGHAGMLDADPGDRLSGSSSLQNPGGLMVLYAEENTRDALFAAMQRREAYATSGTRPTLRFFGGFDLPAGLCAANDLVSQAYATGVPMGGELVVGETAGAPRFVVFASQDPGSAGHPGTPLAEIEIVKGWRAADGTTHESVVAVESSPTGPGAVDPLTCQTDGGGAAALCGEWQDPDFDPAENAFYYARVLESPTCRWSTRICLDEGIDCAAPPPAEFAACCDGSVPKTIQERATSSPIWLRPVPEPGLVTSLSLGLLPLLTKRRLGIAERDGGARRQAGRRSLRDAADLWA